MRELGLWKEKLSKGICVSKLTWLVKSRVGIWKMLASVPLLSFLFERRERGYVWHMYGWESLSTTTNASSLWAVLPFPFPVRGWWEGKLSDPQQCWVKPEWDLPDHFWKGMLRVITWEVYPGQTIRAKEYRVLTRRLVNGPIARKM